MSMLIAALAAALSQAPAEDATAATPTWDQPEFMVGFWCDPPVEKAHYQDVKDAHFNMFLGGFHANTPELAEKQLALCEELGLHAVVMLPGRGPEVCPSGPALMGFGLWDEPSASEFDEVAERVRAYREAFPDKLALVNLFPSYASPWGQLGAPDYDTYVKQFLETVPTQVLSMDHYPQFMPHEERPVNRDTYCDDLGVMRKYALAYGIPFWNFFNAMPYGPHTNPTEAQMRWQMNASIAYGAKGLMYFCYWTPAGGEFPKGGALIRRDGRKTDGWYSARRLNEQVRNFGPTLMQLTSTGVCRVTPEDAPAEALAETPLVNLEREAHDPPHDYLLGVFAHEDGRRAVWMMNWRFAYSAWPTVTFDTPVADIVEVDPWSGEEKPLLDDSPAMEGLQLSFDAAGARLFLLPPRE